MSVTTYFRENRTISVNKPHTPAALGITGRGTFLRDYPEALPSFSAKRRPLASYAFIRRGKRGEWMRSHPECAIHFCRNEGLNEAPEEDGPVRPALWARAADGRATQAFVRADGKRRRSLQERREVRRRRPPMRFEAFRRTQKRSKAPRGDQRRTKGVSAPRARALRRRSRRGAFGKRRAAEGRGREP